MDRPREGTQFGCPEAARGVWSVVGDAAVGVRKMEHRSTTQAPLSACSWQVMPLVAVGFGSRHTPEVGLTSQPIISAPTVGQGPGGTPAVVGGVTESSQNCMSAVESPWGGICSTSFPSRSTPVPPISHHSLEPDLGASTTTAGELTLPMTGL